MRGWAALYIGIAFFVAADFSFAADIVPVAQSEMSELITAQELCFIDTNFYVSLENLDDLPFNTTPNYDYIHDGGGTWVIGSGSANFLPGRRDLLNAFLSWRGPYITYQPGRTDDSDFFNYDIGTPLDPWGTPYYFFTPLGLVDPPNGVTAGFYGDAFDRYTIVSFGPDGEFQGGDDLFMQFGGAPTQPTLSSLPQVLFRAGDLVEFHGYNMGGLGGNIELTFNGSAVTDGIQSWSSTMIQKRITASDSFGLINVQLTNLGNPSGLLVQIMIESPINFPPTELPTAARHWEIFE